jgi:hypothetical protein
MYCEIESSNERENYNQALLDVRELAKGSTNSKAKPDHGSIIVIV